MPDDISSSIQVEQLLKSTRDEVERDLRIIVKIERITASNKDDYIN